MSFTIKTPNGQGKLVRTAHGSEYVTVKDSQTGKLATWHQSQVVVIDKDADEHIGCIVTFKGREYMQINEHIGCFVTFKGREYRIRDVSGGYALVDMYYGHKVTTLGKLIPLEKLIYA